MSRTASTTAIRYFLALAVSLAVQAVSTRLAPADTKPNVVLIFIDDMGYADIGPFGAAHELTPNLNRMASQGRRFTDFHVSSAVCSASRAALLTGCYHRRIGITGALGPKATHGISDGELTIAELCRQQGYATACFGKWHLGHHPKFLPLQHGFDEYFGLPYSNDMWPFHPNFVDLPADSEKRKRNYPGLPLIEDNQVIDAEVTGDDQAQLTTWYTEKATSFIDRHRDRPFFLYVPHSMVHVPLYVSAKFKDRSGRGLFADVLMEVDWSVGQIIKAVERNQLAERTLVIFTSDNGPWLSYGHHAGSAAPLREGKGTMLEGGCRVPTVMQWTNRIPAGSTCDKLASTIDILPTVAKLVGGSLPDHPIDGIDISSLMFDQADDESPRSTFLYYYAGGELQAIREGQWKLVFPHRYRTMAGRPGGRDGMPNPYRQARIELSLFDLTNDIGETSNIAAQHPEIVSRLQALAAQARQDLGDKLQHQEGTGRRQPGQLSPQDERLIW